MLVLYSQNIGPIFHQHTDLDQYTHSNYQLFVNHILSISSNDYFELISKAEVVKSSFLDVLLFSLFLGTWSLPERNEMRNVT